MANGFPLLQRFSRVPRGNPIYAFSSSFRYTWRQWGSHVDGYRSKEIGYENGIWHVKDIRIEPIFVIQKSFIDHDDPRKNSMLIKVFKRKIIRPPLFRFSNFGRNR